MANALVRLVFVKNQQGGMSLVIDGHKFVIKSRREEGVLDLLKRRQDIRLEGEWTETSAGEQFQLIDEGEKNRMLVFATQTNLEHLCNARTIYADGTFYTCPGLFFQLYTWHCFIDGQMYPLMFAFLPGKYEETYETV